VTASPPGSVRLDVLGRLGLATAEGDVSAVLVQPKRIALLVWLVLRRPGAFVRRDEVIGVFWPESTEERARASLRQALQFIRRHLGRDVIRKRGAGELGVNTSLLACDALAFHDAITRGDDAAALQNYGGDLLPGFLLDGAQEFDRWLNGERQRLRTLAVEAALRAAARAEDADDWAAAAEWLARGQRLEPTDEEVACRLMRALERGGNRSAALAAYDALAERLRSELDLEPSGTTTEHFARIRDAAPPTPGSVPVTAGLSRQRVLVLELENRTGEARFAVLGRLASETIARGLADLPDLVVIPPLAVGALPASSPEGGAPGGAMVLPAVAAAARRSGAGTLLDGSIHREGGALWFRVRGDRSRCRPVADGTGARPRG
jgi:DNA-binding SARP family transcriptional activator